MGWPLFAPPGVPVERTEALRAAFTSLINDPEFARAVQSTVKAQLQPTVGSALAEFVDHALDTPDNILSEAKTILGLDRR